MVKSKRAAVPAPQTQAEARDYLARIGNLTRILGGISASMTAQIAAIKEEAENRADPVREQLAILEEGLQVWAEANRAELTKKSKTVDLGTGLIRWRLRPPSVTVRGADKVIAYLKQAGLTRFIRTKEEINKDALSSEPTIANGISGITVKSEGEDFVIEPIIEAVAAPGAENGRAAA